MALRISRRIPEKKTPASVGLGGREKGTFLMLNIIEPPLEMEAKKSLNGRHSTEQKRCREWIETRLNRVNREGSFSEWVTVSPALAEELLHRNPDNRNLSAIYVDRYAQDMTRGHWEANGEPIIIADDGLLNDGQHRLAACVASGHPFKTLFVFGVRRTARLTTDQGRARFAGDYLAMDGVKDGNNMAAVATALWTFEHFGLVRAVSPHMRPTRAETLGYFADHRDEISDALHIVGVKGAHVIGSKSILATTLAMIRRNTFLQHDADTFMLSLIKGENLSSRSWAYVTRERLIAERATRSPNPNLMAEIIIRGWNAHCEKRRVTRLQANGRIPAIKG